MTDTVSVEEIRNAIANVKHPAIDCSLLELGMIQNISLENKTAEITLAFPFPNIPIAEYLINSIKTPLKNLDIQVEFKIIVMDQEQLQRFLDLEKNNWKG